MHLDCSYVSKKMGRSPGWDVVLASPSPPEWDSMSSRSTGSKSEEEELCTSTNDPSDFEEWRCAEDFRRTEDIRAAENCIEVLCSPYQ